MSMVMRAPKKHREPYNRGRKAALQARILKAYRDAAERAEPTPSYVEIAAATGIVASTVGSYAASAMREAGVKVGRNGTKRRVIFPDGAQTAWSLHGNGELWTDEHVEELRRRVANGERLVDIAKALDRKVSSVRRRASNMGIRRPEPMHPSLPAMTMAVDHATCPLEWLRSRGTAVTGEAGLYRLGKQTLTWPRLIAVVNSERRREGLSLFPAASLPEDKCRGDVAWQSSLAESAL